MKTCSICQTTFEILPAEKKFCERITVPESPLCPKCRLRELMATRNEWKLYKRKCDKSGEEILSTYPPDSPFKIYKNAIWWGGTWSALEYGRDFDFNRPFFEQFAELQKEVPREGTSIFNSENCDYNLHIRQSRNCYLNSLVARCEEIYYSYWMVEDKNCFDCLYTNYSSLCYACSDVNNAYNCIMLQESNNCSDCYFSFQLRGCDHCIFSSNLANKSYYLFNKPCTKEQFEEIKNRLLDGSFSRWQEAYKHFLDMRLKAKHRAVHTLKVENSTGDHIYNAKNCSNCFDTHDAEDCANSISLGSTKDIYSCYSAGWPATEVCYNCCVTRGSQNIAFSTYIFFSHNLRYCDSCVSAESCFGCVGVQHKKFCIFNKQYTQQEYETLSAKIIAHMKKPTNGGAFSPRPSCLMPITKPAPRISSRSKKSKPPPSGFAGAMKIKRSIDQPPSLKSPKIFMRLKRRSSAKSSPAKTVKRIIA